MMDWSNGGWGAGSWVAMSAMMTVFWGLVVVSVAWAFRTSRGNDGAARTADRALALLAERFAPGEIDGEEFTRGRELLCGIGPSQVRRG